MKSILTAALLLALPAPVLADNAPKWVDLFNGKDLTGWVDVNTSPDTWSVKDGLLVCQGKPIGVMALLGLIMLAGIAVNDAILLVETARRLMSEGMARREALARAAGIRLRPILMTTTTTVLALTPLAFGAGEAASLRTPLALTVIGGIVASTIGSLFVVPCFYDLLDRLRPGRG